MLDCIVVGARCAGVPLAMHLARAGLRVRVLEAQVLGSDQPFSTHAIEPLGMDELDTLGIGDSIRAVTPPVTGARIAVRDHFFDLVMPADRPMFCPRRSTLDPMLQEAALAEGVDIRGGTRVTGLLREGGRVVGVEAQGAGGRETHRARMVVGADGRNSTVAKLVGAREYISHQSERGGYWAYWRKPACWGREGIWSAFQVAILIDEVARFVFVCDDDMVIMGATPAYATARQWGKQHPERLEEALRAHPITAAVCQSPPLTTPVGLLKTRLFFRESVGPSWALVGDAGLHIDPTAGHGITDALRDARALAEAIIDGRPAALEVYWRRRDVDSIPLYYQGLDMGRMAFMNPFTELFLDAMQRGGEQARARMLEVLERRRKPAYAMPATMLMRSLAKSVFRYPPGLLTALANAVRFQAEVDRQLRRCEIRLERALEALAAGG